MKRSLSFVCLGFVGALGCSAGNSGGSSGFGIGGDSPGSGGTGGSSDASGPSTSGNGGFIPGGGGSSSAGGNSMQPAEVFAHGPTTLYKLDPDTKVVTTVGDFQGCSQIEDIALDKDGQMYATSSSALYLVDKTTAACTHVASGSYPNSLSLVPQGTVDPNDEALVGYDNSTYVRIDKTTGKITDIGQLGGGYRSSGDIVSVIGGSTYLTVKGNGCNDCIVEVDPTTGALIKNIGPLGHASVFGLAFWGGVAYGFDNEGDLFQIDLTNASTMPLSTGVAVPHFWGAGSTTSAPLTPK